MVCPLSTRNFRHISYTHSHQKMTAFDMLLLLMCLRGEGSQREGRVYVRGGETSEERSEKSVPTGKSKGADRRQDKGHTNKRKGAGKREDKG